MTRDSTRLDELVHDGRACEEERHACGDEPGLRRGDVEHRQEDPEVEKSTSEIVGLHEHEHGRAPDGEQRAEVLQSALREHLALLTEIPGEEDDQEDLGQLAGLELHRSELHPEACPVHRLPDQR